MSRATIALKVLGHPTAEAMSDNERLSRFIYWSDQAVTEIEKLRAVLKPFVELTEDEIAEARAIYKEGEDR